MVLFPTSGKITQGKITITHDFIPKCQTLLVKLSRVKLPRVKSLRKIAHGIVLQIWTTLGKVNQGKIMNGKITQGGRVTLLVET